MITEDDIDAVMYFWEEKRNLNRWASWESKREHFRKKYPELNNVCNIPIKDPLKIV